MLLFGDVDATAAMHELERFAGARLVYANVPPDMIGRIREAIHDPSTGPLTQEPSGDDSLPPFGGAVEPSEG